MASPGGTTSNSSSSLQQLQNSSSSEEWMNIEMIDERKRKRMVSNRESAKRSRMRKQKHMNDLMTQATNLRKSNNQILNSINITTQHYLKIEAENSILRAQLSELSSRLQSLNDINNVLGSTTGHNNNNNINANMGIYGDEIMFPNNVQDYYLGHYDNSFMMNPWNNNVMNQPIMASADMFQY